MNGGLNGKYTYEVWRSTKASGGYKKLKTVSAEGNWDYYINYTDTTAKPGATYYYKMRVVTGTDKYIKKNTVVKTSAAAKVVYAKPEASLSVYASPVYDKKGNATSKIAVTIHVYSELANQFVIYKSTKPNSGFKKLKGVYTKNSIEDKNVKKGVTYYYKVVPKYYDKATGKVYTGTASKAEGVKFIMTASYPTVTQVSNTSAKIEWGSLKNTGATAVEVWYKRADLEGDAFKKAVTSKSTSYTLKNMAASGKYSIMLRTVKKAGSVVKYEYSSTNTIQMGYTSSLDYVYSSRIKSAVSSDKKTIAIYTRINWNRDWGASGYIVKAYNNYTKKLVNIKKITSGKTTAYTFKNTITSGKGAKYAYVKVVPYKSGKEGTGDSTYCITTLPAPTNIKATRKDGATVKISWKAVAGAAGYYVYRTSDMGVTDYLGSTTKTAFLDTTVTTATEYTYKVMAYTSSSFGSLTSEEYDGYAAKTYVHKLSTPTIKSISNSAAGSATLKWNKVAGAKYYIIYRAKTKNGKYTKVGAVSASKLTYTDKKLKKGSTYYYKIVVKSVNTGGEATLTKFSAVKGVKISK
jgi:hypothetical protein